MMPYYEHGGVTIYHGDCRDLLNSLPRPKLLLSDPPYGIDYQHGARKGGVKYGMDGESIVGDNELFDPSHLLGIADKTILWGGNHFADRLPSSRGWLVWDKRHGGPVMDQSDVELAWTDFLRTARIFYRRWSGANRGGREQSEGRMHVNQKPVELMGWCISITGMTEGLILDPYMGSGSTLLAARELGLSAIGVEIEERHCETSANRLSQTLLFEHEAA